LELVYGVVSVRDPFVRPSTPLVLLEMQSECMPGPEYFCFNLQAVELTDKLWIARFNHLSEVAADSCLDLQEDREFERFHKLR
jgi:hypothetical protein